jgi:TatA/E family protein of Tat protein translocase
MGPFGVQEMMVSLLLALLLVGPKKLPELARMLGKGLSEFRRAKNELKNTFDTHMRELEREAKLEELKKNPAPPLATTPYTPYSHIADEYGYNGSEFPNEPPVDSHAANGTGVSSEPAPAVHGTVPRSSTTPEPPATSQHEEEHSA